MKRLIALTVLVLIPMVASAETLDLGLHGVFGITFPKGWKFSAQKLEDSGFAVTLSPPGYVNAKCIINLAFAPTPEPVSKEKVQAGVLALSDQFVGASVEKKKVIREFAISGGGYGCYCVFTDASMIGQPSKHDEFKMVGVGIIQFSDDLMAAVSLAADDEKGSDFVAMLAAVSSATITQKK
jgi:hypothetical protein